MAEVRADADLRVLIAARDRVRAAELAHACGAPDARLACSTAEAWAALEAGVELCVAEGEPEVVDALELVRRARAHPTAASTYLLLVCPRPWPAAGSAAFAAGADDCVRAPVDPAELAVRVAAGLGPRGAVRRQARDLAELARRQRDFLSVVSHEIRTPLSAVLSSANILLRYGAQRPDSVARFAAVILEEGRRLTRLIDNLLDLAKIEANEVEWQREVIPLAELLDGVRESFAALVGERNIALAAEVGAGADSVVGDRDKLMQVLVNLVSNAVKFSPEGETVRLRCRQRAGGGLRLEVEDRGPGVPAGAEERIFERFEQLDVDNAQRGTGLGLTIARQIVEHHGGAIRAERGREGGALFVVELPGPERADGPVR